MLTKLYLLEKNKNIVTLKPSFLKIYIVIILTLMLKNVNSIY